jgi:hypothetical protein
MRDDASDVAADFGVGRDLGPVPARIGRAEQAVTGEIVECRVLLAGRVVNRVGIAAATYTIDALDGWGRTKLIRPDA